MDPLLRQQFFDFLPIGQSGARTKEVNESDVREQGRHFPGPLHVHYDDPPTGTQNAPHFSNSRHLHRSGKVVKHQRAEHHVEGRMWKRQAVSRSFHKICGDALCSRFAAGVGEHLSRAINAVRRTGLTNALGSSDKQSPCPAANIQDGVA